MFIYANTITLIILLQIIIDYIIVFAKTFNKLLNYVKVKS